MNNLNPMESTHTINVLNVNRFLKKKLAYNVENLSPNINGELNPTNGRRFRQYTIKSSTSHINNNNNNNQFNENCQSLIISSITNSAVDIHSSSSITTSSSQLSTQTTQQIDNKTNDLINSTDSSAAVVTKTSSSKNPVNMVINKVLTNIPHSLQVATVFQRAQSELQENAIKTYVQYEINEYTELLNSNESSELLVPYNKAPEHLNEKYDDYVVRQKNLKTKQITRKKRKINERTLYLKCHGYNFFNKQLTMEYKRVRGKILKQLQLLQEMGYDINKLPIPAEYSLHYVLD